MYLPYLSTRPLEKGNVLGANWLTLTQILKKMVRVFKRISELLGQNIISFIRAKSTDAILTNRSNSGSNMSIQFERFRNKKSHNPFLDSGIIAALLVINAIFIPFVAK